MSQTNAGRSPANSSMSHYNQRLEEHIQKNRRHEAMCVGIWQLARTADRHLSRLTLALERYRRALLLHDSIAAAYEKETVLALLYETLDTIFIVVQQLDLNQLRLEASSDGSGMVGEDANFLCNLLQRLERTSARTLETAKLYRLALDFKTPVDEREGITYTQHAHWRDFVPGCPEKSFTLYFAQAQHAISARLNEKLRFADGLTYGQVLGRSNRPALREVLRRLESTSFPRVSLSKLVEKESTTEVRHDWPACAARAAVEHLRPRRNRHNLF